MIPPPLPFARLELVDDPMPRDAAMNMAFDEVLLDGLRHDPVLRIYRWRRRSVSIGYFEKFELANRRWPEHDLVRRWTGGGMVEHGDDLTFSLLIPRALPLAALAAAESYRLIHTAVVGALLNGGLSAETIRMAARTPAETGSHACFERPVQHDILLADRKIAGGAQRRNRHGLMHQASVRTASPVELSSVLPGVFGRSIQPRMLTAADIDAAVSLVRTKYGTTAWQQRF